MLEKDLMKKLCPGCNDTDNCLGKRLKNYDNHPCVVFFKNVQEVRRLLEEAQDATKKS